MRFAACLLALLIASFAAAPSAAAAPRAEPKVVLIVGPAGEATQRYRERAEAAARVAERHTSNVVRLYSPNATWPAVKQALEGAAVVVYLGHGNGWPSRYRDTPYGATQNGFGLNPVAGGDDDTHQYFGEDLIAADIRLADNAVVLLHHLCYASGNTEPGLPEGTIDQARQRVVNYAAGFIEAGAGAVVAEGHMGPAWYMTQLLTGNRSIDRIWRASPNARGNEFRFESSRSPGFTAAMDPDHPDRGFYRSIVYRGGVGAGRLEATTAAALPLAPIEPTLLGSGLTVGAPYLREPPVAGSSIRLRFRYEAQQADVLAGLTVGARWDPIDVADGATAEEGAAPEEDAEPEGAAAPSDEVATTGPEEAAPPEPAATTDEEEASDGQGASETPGTGEAAAVERAGTIAESGPKRGPIATPAPSTPAGPDPSTAAPTFIQPERLGDVVEPVAAVVRRDKVGVDLTLPERPGRYRLVLTLHDREGVAYDAATQALVGGVIVDVGGRVWARYLVASSVEARAGRAFELPVGVANVGAERWGQLGAQVPGRRSLDERPVHGVVTAHWVALDGEGVSAESVAAPLSPGLEAGATERIVLGLEAPATPGSYLLVLDVVVPGTGSLAALGVEPALVRVTVD